MTNNENYEINPCTQGETEPDDTVIIIPPEDPETENDPVMIYTIDYDLNGGTGDFPQQERYENSTTVLHSEIPYRQDHTFEGWVATNGDIYQPGSEYNANEPTILTALWVPFPYYTLIYDLNGGTGDFQPEMMLKMNNIVLETEPTREGANFLYWTNSHGLIFRTGDPYFFMYGDDILTAVWEGPYYVTYDLNGGTGDFPNQIKPLELLLELHSAIPERFGYTFLHWLGDDGNIYDPGDIYTTAASLSLTAQWVELPMNSVEYDLNGGTGDFPKQSECLGYPIQIYDRVPLHETRPFIYWTDENGAIYNPGDNYYPTAEEITLTAQWGAPSYTLTYDLNGGTGDFPSESHGEMENINLLDEPTRDGFTFVKWVNKENAEFFTGDPYFYMYGNDTLTAVWRSTTVFDLNGGEGSFSDISGEEGTSTTLPETIPSKEGFVFVRWSSAIYGNMNPGDAYCFGGNDTLTAVWGYTVTINPDGGYCEATTITKAVGDTLDITPTKDGYTFVGWINSNMVEFYNGTPYTFNYGEDYLTAIWGYTVTYDLDCGTGGFSSCTMFPWESFTLPAESPQRDGYLFEYWETADGTVYYPGDVYNGSTCTTFKAIFTCGVTFDADGGTCEGFLYTGFSGTSCGIPTAEREGFTLVHWVNESGVEFPPNGDYWFNYGNDTLTAVWGYTVTIDANGGQCETTIVRALGESLDIIPVKEGLNFVKWVNSSNLEFDESHPYTFNYGNDTLTAIWGYTVTYLDGNGAVYSTQSSLENEAVTILNTAPSLSGYEFTYWLENETNKALIPESQSVLNANTSLIPQWRKMYVLVFLDCDGDYFSIEDKYEGVNFEISYSTPAYSGMEFVCWKRRFDNEYYFAGDMYSKDDDAGFDPVMISSGNNAIVFDLAGGKGDLPLMELNSNAMSFTVPSEVPIRLGYHFMFWTEKGVTDENGNIPKYYPSTTYDIFAETKRLTAVWERDSYSEKNGHDIGSRAHAYINLKTGNLTAEIDDFNYSGNRLPVSIKHIYNGAYAGNQYTSSTDIDANCANFSEMNIGNGFRLNLMQSMKKTDIFHSDGVTSQYVYTDENGDETYFILDEDRVDEIYKEKNGNDITYDSEARVMRSGNDNYIFDLGGKLIKYIDEYGNTTVYTYYNEKLISVTDGSGRVFTLAYNGKKLTSITAPDGSCVSYEYSDNYLSKVIFPDLSGIELLYNGSQLRLIKAINQNGETEYARSYVYDKSDRIGVIVEKSKNESGKISGYAYNEAGNFTTVKTQMRYDNRDNYPGEFIDAVYTFDESGNISGQYVRSYETGTSSETAKNYPLISISNEVDLDVKPVINNLLTKHMGETLYGWSVTSEDGTFNVTVENDTTGRRAKFGNKYIQMDSSNISNRDFVHGITQDISLPAGEYTFSAYVRLHSGFSSDNSGVFLRITDSDYNVLSVSECTKENEEIYTRIYTSFTLEQSDVISVWLLTRGNGIAWVNAMQLEQNPYMSTYNLIENGSFERGLSAWSSPMSDTYSSSNAFDLEKSAFLSGVNNENVCLCQNVSVKPEQSTRETFTLSGWAKSFNYNKKHTYSTFRLKARINYADEYEEFYSNFQPFVTAWQYGEVQFCKSKFKEVLSIDVFCEYGFNNGGAYFDSISLTRDYIETGLTAKDFEDYEEETEDTNVPEDSAETEFEEATDIYGNAITETTISDAGTIYRSFAYGNNGNDLVRETDSRGHDTLYTVDPETSRVTSVTDRCGNKTAYEYDSMGRTTKVTSKKKNGVDISNVSYSYDAIDNMTEIVRGDGMKYVLEYDAYHNLDSIGIDGKSEKLIKYTYRDNNGRLKKITYANGDYMRLAYDRFGNMISEKWYDKDNNLTYEYLYAYDGEGNIVKTIDKDNKKEYNYSYDEGKLVSSSEYDTAFTPKSLNVRITYVYDDDGELLKKKVRYANGSESYIMPARNAADNVDSSQFYSNASGIASFVTSSTTDDLGRKVTDSVKGITRTFTYHDGEVTAEHTLNGKVNGDATTQLVDSITYSDGRTISYEYDNEERITRVVDSLDGTTVYTYDALGQLLTETKNGTVINAMTYDGYGNIKTKNGKSYGYTNSVWKDLLTQYNGQSISYDAQGNPTRYRGKSLVWEKGRQLKAYGTNSYTYNANGIRTSKTVSGVKHSYILDGPKVLKETWGTNTLIPLYDNEDSVCGISYNGTSYYFIKNLQGDIIAIADASNTVVARYTYDAWGKCTVVSDSTDVSIATINPYRYRGYYYDVETGLYYLQSRYYDPEVGRFINGDEVQFSMTNESVQSHNIFSYCYNSPVINCDTTGYIAHNVVGAVVGVFMSLGTYFLGVLMGFDTFSWWSLLWAVVGGAASGAFGASIYKRAIQVIFNIIDSVAVNVISCLNKAKVTLEQVVQEVFIGAIVGLISGLVGGSGNGKLFKKASNQYVKKWLTRNKSLIVKGTKYYVKSFAKLFKQKVIKPIFKAFMAGLITNIALRKKFERLLA